MLYEITWLHICLVDLNFYVLREQRSNIMSFYRMTKHMDGKG